MEEFVSDSGNSEELVPVFDGDPYHEESILAFVRRELPNDPAAFHEELTAFFLGLDAKVEMSPLFNKILDTRQDVENVIASMLEAKFRPLRKEVRSLEVKITHEQHEVESFIYRIIPDFAREATEMVAIYIQLKKRNLEVAPDMERCVQDFCTTYPALIDILAYFFDRMTTDSFLERYAHMFHDDEEEEDDFL